MKFAFSGPRSLTRRQERRIYRQVNLKKLQGEWHIGDAEGVDSFMRRAANYYQMAATIHRVDGGEKWQFAQRSKRMVDAIAPGGILVAFPDKSCPSDCVPSDPFSGHGSGTWGTIAYAKSKLFQIEIYPLRSIDIPDWFFETQLSLF
ncbi:hypothetical protein IQ235_01025 [Oscillatoriales cyanobacterium LEGE 11467]|uniref:Uncharacterized protein n=1 Tax=Zarconia navalis LEGE 11467 TaxID=1828826 RepID=A0A928VU57_9CYAN|nr:hypothetical protein [Zarconia navalis]MBE9039378.1 hypothetical protein [Zarconia navalis LEGE 11467]